MWRLVYDPVTGNFELRKIPVAGGNGTAGGTLTSGTLVFPSGVEIEMNGGMATSGSSTITLEPNSQILLLP